MYRIARMFGGVNVWRIGRIKSIWRKKFGEKIGFSHKDNIHKLKVGWLKLGETQTTRQIRQTFPLPNISAIRYVSFTISKVNMYMHSIISYNNVLYYVDSYDRGFEHTKSFKLGGTN